MTSLAKTLYDFSNLMNQIEENNGEISNDLLPVITKAELDIAQKIDNYVYFNDAVKAQIDNTKKLIDNFKKRLQVLENLESRLKDNVKHVMQNFELIALQGNERAIKLVNAGGVAPTYKPDDMFYTVECIDSKYITELEEYIEEKTIYIIKDKEKFKEAVKQNKLHSCYLLPRSKCIKFI